jgi:hypothetical protein
VRAFNIANVLEQRGALVTDDRGDYRLVALGDHVLSHRAVVHLDSAFVQKKKRIRARLKLQLVKNI